MSNYLSTPNIGKTEPSFLERIVEVGMSTLKLLGLVHPDHTKITPSQAAFFRDSIERSRSRE